MGRHRGAQHAAAALVAVDLLRHDRLRDRLRRSLYPAWPLVHSATRRACSAIRAAASVDERDGRAPRPRRRRCSTRSPRCRSSEIADDPELMRFAGRRRARGLPGQLRPVPRLGRGRLARAIPTSTTTTGCGAAPSTRSSTTITHGVRYAGRSPTRARRRCRPSARRHPDAGRRSPTSADYVLSLCRRRRTTRRWRQARQAAVRRQLRRLPRRRRAAATASSARRDLTDAIWLYGGDATSIVAQITQAAARRDAGLGRAARPGRRSRSLRVYVHSLGGGEAEVASCEDRPAGAASAHRRRD